MSAGTFGNPGTHAGAQPQASTSGRAIASLVFGILALTTFVVWGSMVFGPLAVVFGALARNDARGPAARGGYGLAITGIVLGIVAMALTIVFAIIGFATS